MMYISFATMVLIIVLLLIGYFCFRDTLRRVGKATATVVECSSQLAEVGMGAMVQLAAHNASKMQVQLQQEQEQEIAPAYSKLQLRLTPIQFNRAITRHQAELVSDDKGHLLPQNEQDLIIRDQLIKYMDNLRGETVQPKPDTATTVKAKGTPVMRNIQTNLKA